MAMGELFASSKLPRNLPLTTSKAAMVKVQHFQVTVKVGFTLEG
jgi:hypothetical protein